MDNPFRHRIVASPWNDDGQDIPEINEEAFSRCVEAFRSVSFSKKSLSVLLHGEPGAGKTHLLGRFRRYLLESDKLCVFAFIRLQTSPRGFWRHIRRMFVENLARKSLKGKTQLELIVLYRLGNIIKKRGMTRSDGRTLKEHRAEFFKDLRRDANLSEKLFVVVEHIARGRHVADAWAWLKGESISGKAMEKMNLQNPGENEDSEENSREIVLALCRLGAPVPMVICFDQIEALQRFPEDRDGLFVFGQAIRTLHDETDNLLMVSCIQSFFQPYIRKAVPESDYDAMSGVVGSLNPLTKDECRKLVRARIFAFPETSESHGELLGRIEKQIIETMAPQDRTARKVLLRCADFLDGLNQGPGSGKNDFEYLDEEIRVRSGKLVSNAIPERTGEIIRNAIPLFIGFVDEHVLEKDGKIDDDLDIELKGPKTGIGISVCNQKNMNALAARLRRLLERVDRPRKERIVIIRDPGRTLPPTAKKTKEYLDALKRHPKVHIIEPDAETIALLSHLTNLVTDARSGDLYLGDREINERTVMDWLKNRMHPRAKSFLADLISEKRNGKPGPDEKQITDVLKMLETEHVISLADASKKLNRNPEELLKTSRLHVERIGILDGPLPVLFQLVPSNTVEEP